MNMRILSLLLLFALAVGCQKSISPEEKAVDAAQLAFKEDPSENKAKEVIQAMSSYVNTFGYKDSTSANYVLKAARISSKQLKPLDARQWYRTYLIHYPDRPGKADLMAEYITVSEKLNQQALNDVLYNSFAANFSSDPRAETYKTKVVNKDISADSLVRYIGLNMFNDSTFRLDQASARLYVELCQDLVMANPGLNNPEKYIYHAAETAGTLRDVHKAIDLYDWIIEQYPTSKWAATSLFLKGFTLDRDLQQFDEAKIYYEAFLEQYPNSEFAESAQFLLDNLGQSEEELIKMLNKNAKPKPQ